MVLKNIILIAAGLACSLPTSADSVGCGSTGATGAGVTQSFPVNGGAVQATGYAGAGGAATNLLSKKGPDPDTGLGLAATPSHEIGGKSFIQLDLTQLLNSRPASSVLALGSVERGERYNARGSNTAGLPETLLGNGGRDAATFNLPGPGSYRFSSIGSPRGTVLLDGRTAKRAAAVPESSAGSLLIVGLMSLAAAGLFFRRALTLGLRERAAI
jgi:hypothetical protein